MNVIGIVAEYNPFHTGHAYQIAQSRAQLGESAPVVAVMSGNWVQQAHCAVADKWSRARLALMGGADLVLELPTVFACSSAEKFAQGAVDILEATGVVTHLSFGSECGDVDKLHRLAACLDSPAYDETVRRFADMGLPFATCRQWAAEELLGEELGRLLANPNNNLGVEYVKALTALKSTIQPMTVRRRGAAHNSISTEKLPFLSATQIRQELYASRPEHAEPWLIPGSLPFLKELPGLERIERVLLAKVRTMTAEDWGKLPDSGAAEGLPQRLEKAGKQCRSMAEFYEQVKTKRYPHARLRRLVLWAYLGLTETDRPERAPYIRVLGFNQRGQALLKQMKHAAALPVLTKPAHARKLEPFARDFFALESRCTDLYDLCFEHTPVPGREYTTDVVRMGGAGDE